MYNVPVIKAFYVSCYEARSQRRLQVILPCTYFMYLTHLIEIFSIFVIRYGKTEESSTRYTGDE